MAFAGLVGLFLGVKTGSKSGEIAAAVRTLAEIGDGPRSGPWTAPGP
jgi:hypothetical protein